MGQDRFEFVKVDGAGVVAVKDRERELVVGVRAFEHWVSERLGVDVQVSNTTNSSHDTRPLREMSATRKTASALMSEGTYATCTGPC